MSDKSYGPSIDLVLDLDTVANTRSYGPSVDLVLDLDTVANTRSYGPSVDLVLDLDTVANTRSYGPSVDLQINNTVIPGPYYKCDTGSGTTLNDDSVSGAFDGTLTDAGIWSATGGPGGSTCLELDGTDTYTGTVDTGSDTTSGINSVTNTFSISTWIKPDAAGGTVLSKRLSNDDAQFVISVASTGVLTLEYEKSGNSYSLATSAGAVNMSGAWQHVAIAVNDDSPPVIKIYINASEVASGTATATVSASSADLLIGKPAPALVAPSYYWRFNTGSGTTLVDAIGGANGAITGATWTAGAGPDSSMCLDFDASSSNKVQVATGTSTTSGLNAMVKNFTISTWAYPETLTGGHVIIGKFQDSSWKQFGIRLNSVGAVRCDYETSGDNFFIESAAGVATTGSWQNFALTVSDSSTPTITLYKNGVAIATGSNGVTGARSADIGIGYNGPTYNSEYFDGKLDEIAIWDGTVLSASDLVRIYNSGSPPDLTSGISDGATFDGRIDEIAFWPAYTLTPDNVTAIYNGGSPADVTNGIPELTSSVQPRIIWF